jgi:hypothetical protein
MQALAGMGEAPRVRDGVKDPELVPVKALHRITCHGIADVAAVATAASMT